MKERAQKLLKRIENDINTNRFILPSLPEVAFCVRSMAANPDCSVSALEREISKDAAMAARLIKVANSSALRYGKPVTALKQAIVNLGFDLVRSLVTQLAILQTMQAEQISKDKCWLQGFVESGLRISSLSRTLAVPHVHLDAELASLGGLLHDIGKLPLRDFLFQQKELTDFERLQFEFILHPYVGALILKRWNMADELVQIARWHESVMRETGRSEPDYVDVVISANLLHYGQEKGRYLRYAGMQIPALYKCGAQLQSEDPECTAQRVELAQALLEA